jgi:DNA-binding GntR family transcriptional regulator
MTEALAIASVRLEHASLAERAYQLIRERILKGELRLELGSVVEVRTAENEGSGQQRPDNTIRHSR